MRPVVISLTCLAAQPLFAAEGLVPETDDDPIVITASRLPEPVGETVTPVVVIDEDEARRYGRPIQPTDLLDTEPGVLVTTNGGLGQVTRVRLRGARGEGTQVLYEGVPHDDPAGLQSDPDLALLNPAAIDHIELLKGPQSGLYGSRAIGGVVNLRAPRPGRDHRGVQRIAWGSFQSVDSLLQATGPVSERLGYAVGASLTRSDGITAATTEPDGQAEDFEEDGFRRAGGYFALHAHPCDAVEVVASVNGLQAETEFDGFLAPDDPLPYQEHEFVRPALRVAYGDDRLRLAADLAWSHYDRSQPNAAFGSKRWIGREWYGAVRGDYALTAAASVAGGIDAKRERALARRVGGGDAVDERARHLGAWLRLGWDDGTWRGAATLRREHHDEAGDATTWRIEAARAFDDGRSSVFAAAGTAFRAPSLYELYSQDTFFDFVTSTLIGPFGNDDLEPEESSGYELGHRHRLFDHLVVANTAFSTRYDQRIVFDATSGYVNSDTNARVDGLESEFAWDGPGQPLALRLVHTWQEASDEDSDLALLLPRSSWQVDLVVRPHRGVQCGVFVTAVDDRVAFGGVEMDRYYLLDAAVAWRLDEGIELFARGENLTEQDYELADGFATPGPAGYLGAVARW